MIIMDVDDDALFEYFKKIPMEQCLWALQHGIEKWDAVANQQRIESGSQDCKLCQIKNRCELCIVYIVTRQKQCNKIGWLAWVKEALILCFSPRKVALRVVNSEAAFEAALEMKANLEKILLIVTDFKEKYHGNKRKNS